MPARWEAERRDGGGVAGIMESDAAQDARVVLEQALDEQPARPAALAGARARLEARLADAEEGPGCGARCRTGCAMRPPRCCAREVCLRRWAGAPEYARRRAEEERLLAVLEGRVGALPPGAEEYEPLVVWAPADVAERIQTGIRPDLDAPPPGA